MVNNNKKTNLCCQIAFKGQWDYFFFVVPKLFKWSQNISNLNAISCIKSHFFLIKGNKTFKNRWKKVLRSLIGDKDFGEIIFFSRVERGFFLSVCPEQCPKLLNGFDLKFLTFFRNSVKYLTSNFNPVSIFGQIHCQILPIF